MLFVWHSTPVLPRHSSIIPLSFFQPTTSFFNSIWKETPTVTIPPLSPVPQDQPLADGRVIQPKDMRAITVNKNTKVIAKDLQGNRINLAVNKGRTGYGICDAPGMAGYVLCQLVNNNSRLQTVAMRKSGVNVGELHGLRVERPSLEEEKPTRREWLRYHVAVNGEMSIFRSRSSVQDDYVKTLIRQPSTYMYTLPSHPGFLPTLHQRPQAIQFLVALPEYDYYNLKGDLDTKEDDVGEQEESDEGEGKFGGVA
ncbi:hypothetical protein CMUS01_04471 [Colletotrichum musicola]|uniref:Uncharacterized protein n=1 Tax=Colletotrichum musicola TaxID=2175873 RepID=A0A8H6KW92_9PEZI|nr:hypothetical protein CMUS01_04471 [Colletotrichum musicola]